MYKALYLAILLVLTSSMFFSKTKKPFNKKENSKKLLSEPYNSSTSSTCTMCK